MSAFKFTEQQSGIIRSQIVDLCLRGISGGLGDSDVDRVVSVIEDIVNERGGQIRVKAIQDESGHWFVIPNELLSDFRRDEINEDMVDSGEFGNKYGKYLTGGDLNLVQLYIQSPPKTEQ